MSVSSEAEETAETLEATAEVFAMDTYISLKAYGSRGEEALDAVSTMISDLDARLSVTDTSSEIYAINAAAGTPVTVSDTTISLIQRSVEFGSTVSGALDITIYPISRTWGFTTGVYQVPTAESIVELLQYVNDDAVVVDAEASTVLVPENTEVDLGAVVKGYAGDQAVEILKEYGVTSALLNLGGSTIRALGAKPDGSSWRIAIQDPNDESGATYAGVLTVTDCAIDTSGGYERYFEEDGVTYWHIIDPSTGYPAKSGLISVTILSADSFSGDCLSTACFVMGLEDTISYWRTYGDFEFVLITEENVIYVSEGAEELFTPVNDFENAELIVVPYEE